MMMPLHLTAPSTLRLARLQAVWTYKKEPTAAVAGDMQFG